MDELAKHYPGHRVNGVPEYWNFSVEELPNGGIRNVIVLAEPWALKATASRAVALLKGLPPSHVSVTKDGVLVVDTSKFSPADADRLAEYDERVQFWTDWIDQKQKELDTVQKAISAGATDPALTGRESDLKMSIRAFEQAIDNLRELRRRAAAGLL